MGLCLGWRNSPPFSQALCLGPGLSRKLCFSALLSQEIAHGAILATDQKAGTWLETSLELSLDSAQSRQREVSGHYLYCPSFLLYTNFLKSLTENYSLGSDVLCRTKKRPDPGPEENSKVDSSVPFPKSTQWWPSQCP